MKKMTDIEKNTQKLLEASQKGQLEEVKKLLPISDPKARDSVALCWASQYGHTEVVKLLLPVSDPKANGSLSLRLSSQYGHVDIVKLLLPISDPKVCNSQSLCWASNKNNVELFNLLYPVSEPEKALEWMKIRGWNTNLLEERLKSEHEKKRIQTVLQEQGNNHLQKKIKQKKL